MIYQDTEDSSVSVEHQEVRQKIREALENGVRRMNLNTSRTETRRGSATKRAVEARGGGEPLRSGGDCRRALSSTLKNISRLQQDIEQSFRTARLQIQDSQGRRWVEGVAEVQGVQRVAEVQGVQRVPEGT